ncbi:hypothetical protein ADUPG1_000879 [Aduncisulcus paluster]|uniref:Uncharacterized protein n=1 Tax=Aduncisulcus paluster TaxID=2918883 RepID=A0ABQ5K8D1_9EUKA|nr:hypothetical protein ADUPG1_000879 [Aduncisulcus paluster]
MTAYDEADDKPSSTDLLTGLDFNPHDVTFSNSQTVSKDISVELTESTVICAAIYYDGSFYSDVSCKLYAFLDPDLDQPTKQLGSVDGCTTSTKYFPDPTQLSVNLELTRQSIASNPLTATVPAFPTTEETLYLCDESMSIIYSNTRTSLECDLMFYPVPAHLVNQLYYQAQQYMEDAVELAGNGGDSDDIDSLLDNAEECLDTAFTHTHTVDNQSFSIGVPNSDDNYTALVPSTIVSAISSDLEDLPAGTWILQLQQFCLDPFTSTAYDSARGFTIGGDAYDLTTSPMELISLDNVGVDGDLSEIRILMKPHLPRPIIETVSNSDALTISFPATYVSGIKVTLPIDVTDTVARDMSVSIVITTLSIAERILESLSDEMPASIAPTSIAEALYLADSDDFTSAIEEGDIVYSSSPIIRKVYHGSYLQDIGYSYFGIDFPSDWLKDIEDYETENDVVVGDSEKTLAIGIWSGGAVYFLPSEPMSISVYSSTLAQSIPADSVSSLTSSSFISASSYDLSLVHWLKDIEDYETENDVVVGDSEKTLAIGIWSGGAVYFLPSEPMSISVYSSTLAQSIPADSVSSLTSSSFISASSYDLSLVRNQIPLPSTQCYICDTNIFTNIHSLFLSSGHCSEFEDSQIAYSEDEWNAPSFIGESPLEPDSSYQIVHTQTTGIDGSQWAFQCDSLAQIFVESGASSSSSMNTLLESIEIQYWLDDDALAILAASSPSSKAEELVDLSFSFQPSLLATTPHSHVHDHIISDGYLIGKTRAIVWRTVDMSDVTNKKYVPSAISYAFFNSMMSPTAPELYAATYNTAPRTTVTECNGVCEYLLEQEDGSWEKQVIRKDGLTEQTAPLPDIKYRIPYIKSSGVSSVCSALGLTGDPEVADDVYELTECNGVCEYLLEQEDGSWEKQVIRKDGLTEQTAPLPDIKYRIPYIKSSGVSSVCSALGLTEDPEVADDVYERDSYSRTVDGYDVVTCSGGNGEDEVACSISVESEVVRELISRAVDEIQRQADGDANEEYIGEISDIDVEVVYKVSTLYPFPSSIPVDDLALYAFPLLASSVYPMCIDKAGCLVSDSSIGVSSSLVESSNTDCPLILSSNAKELSLYSSATDGIVDLDIDFTDLDFAVQLDITHINTELSDVSIDETVDEPQGADDDSIVIASGYISPMLSFIPALFSVHLIPTISIGDVKMWGKEEVVFVSTHDESIYAQEEEAEEEEEEEEADEEEAEDDSASNNVESIAPISSHASNLTEVELYLSSASMSSSSLSSISIPTFSEIYYYYKLGFDQIMYFAFNLEPNVPDEFHQYVVNNRLTPSASDASLNSISNMPSLDIIILEEVESTQVFALGHFVPLFSFVASFLSIICLFIFIGCIIARCVKVKRMVQIVNKGIEEEEKHELKRMKTKRKLIEERHRELHKYMKNQAKQEKRITRTSSASSIHSQSGIPMTAPGSVAEDSLSRISTSSGTHVFTNTSKGEKRGLFKNVIGWFGSEKVKQEAENPDNPVLSFDASRESFVQTSEQSEHMIHFFDSPQQVQEGDRVFEDGAMYVARDESGAIGSGLLSGATSGTTDQKMFPQGRLDELRGYDETSEVSLLSEEELTTPYSALEGEKGCEAAVSEAEVCRDLTAKQREIYHQMIVKKKMEEQQRGSSVSGSVGEASSSRKASWFEGFKKKKSETATVSEIEASDSSSDREIAQSLHDAVFRKTEGERDILAEIERGEFLIQDHSRSTNTDSLMAYMTTKDKNTGAETMDFGVSAIRSVGFATQTTMTLPTRSKLKVVLAPTWSCCSCHRADETGGEIRGAARKLLMLFEVEKKKEEGEITEIQVSSVIDTPESISIDDIDDDGDYDETSEMMEEEEEEEEEEESDTETESVSGESEGGEKKKEEGEITEIQVSSVIDTPESISIDDIDDDGDYDETSEMMEEEEEEEEEEESDTETESVSGESEGGEVAFEE